MRAITSRRFIETEATSQLAVWALRIAGFAVAATVLAIVIVRLGQWETKPAVTAFAGALAIAVIALLVAFAALAVIWMEGLGGMRTALAAMAISLLLLTYPAYLGLKAYHLPWIYDVTTDPIDAPRYEWLARIRPADANPAAYAGLYAAEQQRRAYPDIGPLSTSATPEAAYKAALTVMNKHKDSFLAPYWRVVDAREPAGRRDGRIEAVARSTLMGFRDDVVVRVREDPDGARIDARSSSRYGWFDFGTNASRIRRLLNDIEDMIRIQKTERPRTPPPAKKPVAKKDQPKRDRERR
ncbi:MAG TPA: DUF1499 domain-containing protein [Xanthobacteraceae bacterium]